MKIAVLGIGTYDAQISSKSWRIMAVIKLGDGLRLLISGTVNEVPGTGGGLSLKLFSQYPIAA